MVRDMVYDGQKLQWWGHGVFKASSGLNGYQMPTEECNKGSGPIPEGVYKVLLADRGMAVGDLNDCTLQAGWGIQKIPRGAQVGLCEVPWAAWGNNRARMEPADEATTAKCHPFRRSGFYLHDSTKGFSHGCIEVEGRLFPLLRSHHQITRKNTLTLKVKYVPGRSTYGGTRL